MGYHNQDLILNKYRLKPGFIFLPATPTIIAAVLGSCVAICLYDTLRKVGGMNHFLFPETPQKNKSTAKYGNAASMALISMMCAGGSELINLKAQIFGGAHTPRFSHKNIGLENINITKSILQKKNIEIIGEDVGGQLGRKVIFNSFTNEVAVLKVDNLRQSDWFPYPQLNYSGFQLT